MPAAVAAEPAAPSVEKRSKKDKSKKKRPRENEEPVAAVEDAEVESPRKHKRSKSQAEVKPEEEEDVVVSTTQTGGDGEVESPVKKHKKSKKSKEKKVEAEAEDAEAVQEKKKKKKKTLKEEKSQDFANEAVAVEPEQEVTESTSKKSKKDKKHKHELEEENQAQDEAAMAVDVSTKKSEKKPKKSKDKKKKKHDAAPVADAQPDGSAADPFADDPMDIDSTTANPSAAAGAVPRSSASSMWVPMDAPEQPSFPFHTQTISLYVPLYPVGFHEPITRAIEQHLAPQLNHYSPTLKGVLLGYRNACIAERPVRANPRNPPTDETPAILHSVDEYAVGFGWLTSDVDLFVPSRGAWMEGVVNLQSEGHIGVVCWDKFNASIEAKRLPPGWRWVDLASGIEEAAAAQEGEEDILDDENLQVAEQMHATGYWVDDGGRRIRGRLQFRVKNFDVGLAGEYGYLSMEGTMLCEPDERALAVDEREQARRHRHKIAAAGSGFQSKSVRRVPEFSMTRFGREDEEEDSGRRVVISKSRPATPDD